MGFFGDLFGSSSSANPYKAGSKYMKQVPGQLHEFYDPYIGMGDTGRDQMGQLGQEYQGMFDDPGAYQQRMGEGFQESPGYQWNLDQQQQAQNQAMAAGGMSGSPQSQQFAQQLASHLADQEYGGYLDRNMGIAGSGLQGQQGLADTNIKMGYDASGQMAQNMQDYLYNMANLKAGQAQDKRNRTQGIFGSALGLGSNMLGGFGGSSGGGGNSSGFPSEMTSMAGYL